MLDLVGEAGSGAAALELLEALDPDFMLVDLMMPGLNGIETTRHALSLRPRLKVIVITLHNDRRMLDRALEAGAAGFFLKDRLGEELSGALAAVARGETYVGTGVPGAGNPRPPRPRLPGHESS